MKTSHGIYTFLAMSVATSARWCKKLCQGAAKFRYANKVSACPGENDTQTKPGVIPACRSLSRSRQAVFTNELQDKRRSHDNGLGSRKGFHTERVRS